MDIVIWLILTICAVFFTALMLVIEDFSDIKGFGLVIAIVSLIFWITVGVSSINLSQTFLITTGGTITEQTVYYANTWPLAFFFALASIFSLMMILKKIPETWPGVENP
jgi:hypothetical protein